MLKDAAWMLGCAAVALVLLLPLVGRIGAATAVGQVDSTSMGAWQALVEVVQKPYFGFEGPEPAAAVLWTVWGVVAMVVLAAGSVSLWRRSPVARGVVAGTWVFLVLAILAYTGHGSMLTVPWYGSGNRLLVQACALGVVPTAAAAVGAARWVAGRGSRVLAAAAVAGVVLLGGMLVARTVQMGDTSFRRAMVTSDHVAAFRWLAAHSAPGERVLNDPRAGTVWVYESTGGAVAPVFGPKHDWRTDPVWAGRVYLQDHVAQAGSDPRVAEEATRWGVRYVLVGPSVVPGGTPTLDPAALAEASGLREVFRSGDVRVYELAR